MKERFSDMTKHAPRPINATRKWGIVGIIFILIIGICFVFGISYSQKQVEPKPFTAFGEDMAKKTQATITLNYAFTSDMKFSVYHVGKQKITNIDIQPSCYTIDVKNTQTIIAFKGLVKGEKYIFVKEPYDPKFPEVPILWEGGK